MLLGVESHYITIGRCGRRDTWHLVMGCVIPLAIRMEFLLVVFLRFAFS